MKPYGGKARPRGDSRCDQCSGTGFVQDVLCARCWPDDLQLHIGRPVLMPFSWEDKLDLWLPPVERVKQHHSKLLSATPAAVRYAAASEDSRDLSALCAQ